MEISDLFLGLALLSICWGVVSGIFITNFLMERGIKINFFLYRLYIIKYVHQYKQITEAEDSQPGPWFHSFVLGMSLTLLFSAIGIALKLFNM